MPGATGTSFKMVSPNSSAARHSEFIHYMSGKETTANDLRLAVSTALRANPFDAGGVFRMLRQKIGSKEISVRHMALLTLQTLRPDFIEEAVGHYIIDLGKGRMTHNAYLGLEYAGPLARRAAAKILPLIDLAELPREQISVLLRIGLPVNTGLADKLIQVLEGYWNYPDGPAYNFCGVRYALRLLGQVLHRHHHKRALDTLYQANRSWGRYEEYYNATVDAIANIGGDYAIRLLHKIAKHQPDRAQFQFSLRLHKLGKAALPLIRKYIPLSSEDGLWRLRAIGSLGPDAASEVQLVVRYLDIPGGKWRRHSAIEALGNIGPSAKSAVPALHRFISDADQIIRCEAAVALWRIDPSELKLSVDTISGELPNDGAARRLRLFGSGAICALPRLLQYAPDSPEIVETIGRIGPRAKKAVPSLKVLLQSQQRAARCEAAIAIFRILHPTRRPYYESMTSTHLSNIFDEPWCSL